MNEADCPCKIIFYGLSSDMGGEIKHCPLHASAPAFLAALEEIATFKSKVPGPLEGAIEIARAAIAQAKVTTKREGGVR